MIGDNARKIIANMSKNVHVTRVCPISLSAEPIHEIDVIKRTPGAYFSNLQYTIRYAQNDAIKYKKGRPFLLKIDLFDTVEKCGHRVANYEELLNGDRFKEFMPFLTKYTNLGPELFEIAKQNPILDIPISFDVIKYLRDASEKYFQYQIDAGVSGDEIKYTFLTEIGTQICQLEEQEKVIHKTNSRDRVYKGVINK